MAATVSTSAWTLLGVHKKRGNERIQGLGVLPTYKGIVVHDCYMSYFKYIFSYEHALCNAHLIRECQGIVEYDKHRWASRMKELLQESWKLTLAVRQQELPVTEKVIQDIKQRYDEILEAGKA